MDFNILGIRYIFISAFYYFKRLIYILPFFILSNIFTLEFESPQLKIDLGTSFKKVQNQRISQNWNLQVHKLYQSYQLGIALRTGLRRVCKYTNVILHLRQMK
jgi:hypothetical protein